ncbi:MAG: zf-HC2 domain-containing protein [Nocardioides sp.]
MTCAFGHDDGAYVLGALSPTDRKAFEDHLSTCADCQKAVRELAGLPGLLSRVDASVLESADDDEPVPAGVLPALLRDVRRERRRRTWLAVGAAAAAAVVVATATFTVTRLNDTGDGTSANPSATSSSTTTGRPMAPVGDVTGVQATLDVASVAWGTKLELTCSYEGKEYDAPEGYALVVRTRDGHSERVATWKSLPGRTMRLAAATATSRSDIASVEMQTMDGLPVLELSD